VIHSLPNLINSSNNAKSLRSLSILYQNVRGIKTKLLTWNTNMSLLEHDIIAVTETFLDQSVMDAEVAHNDWNVLRRDRGSWGGGVLLAARSGLSLLRRRDLETTSGEDLWATVTINSHTYFLCVVYIPPGVNDCVYFELFFKIESFIHNLKAPVIIVGDINMNSATLNVRNYYCYFLSFCNVCDQNDIYNSFGSKLDIILSQECVTAVKVSKSECGGIVRVDPYHPPLDIEAVFSVNVNNELLQPSNIQGLGDWNFNKVDFSLLSDCMSDIDWSPVLQSSDVVAASSIFYEIIYKNLDVIVPKKTRFKLPSKRYPVWFSADIIKDIKLKSRVHRQWKRSNCLSTYAHFANLRSSLKTRISSAYTSHMRRLEQNLQRNPRGFWRHISGLRSKGGFEPSVMFNDCQVSGIDAANAFANYFSSVYEKSSSSQNSPLPITACNNNTCVYVGNFTVTDVCRAIGQLKPGLCPGPDGIPADLIKMSKSSLATPLCHLINLILKSTVYPPSWKVSRVTPIPKGNGGLGVEEHRPIAIIPSAAKVFEILVHNVLYRQVQSFICNEQHGFRPGRSVTTNLLAFVEHVSCAMERGRQTDVVYFDFRKAFDRVDCNILILKLNAFGFPPELVALFRDYLRDRKQFVRYGCYESGSYPTPSGVTQGSVLGPLLFLIMINDLVSVLKYSKCRLYADDVKLFAEVKYEHDCQLIQDDIDALNRWSLDNKMRFNHDKCNIMTFSRQRKPIVYDYKLGGG
jgi:hypothetical protein